MWKKKSLFETASWAPDGEGAGGAPSSMEELAAQAAAKETEVPPGPDGEEEVSSTATFVDPEFQKEIARSMGLSDEKPGKGAEGAEGEGEGEAAPPENKAAKGLLKRVDRLTAERNAEREAKQVALDELAFAKEQLRLMTKEGEEPPKPTPAPLTPADIEARAQELAASRARVEAFETAAVKTYEAGKAEYKDFDSVVQGFKALGDPDVLFPVLEAILEEPASHRILYELSLDLEEAEKLFSLSPVRLGKTLAALNTKYAKPKAVSRVPAPVVPLDPAAGGGEKPLSKIKSVEDWMEQRNREVAARGRR